MDNHVYAPPSRREEPPSPQPRAAPRPTYELFSPGQIYVAILFGGVVSATVLTALNYRRLGHNALALTAYLWGLTAVVLDFDSVMRGGAPSLVGPFVVAA